MQDWLLPGGLEGTEQHGYESSPGVAVLGTPGQGDGHQESIPWPQWWGQQGQQGLQPSEGAAVAHVLLPRLLPRSGEQITLILLTLAAISISN